MFLLSEVVRRVFPRLLGSLLAGVAGALLWLSPPPAEASLLHLKGPTPTDLGVHGDALAPCASPAHCALSHWPVADPQASLARLLPAVLAMEGVDLVETRDRYLHATFTSRLFGFVDDLELFADPGRGEIQARSSSRLGESDLGVNARRLERIHRVLDAPLP